MPGGMGTPAIDRSVGATSWVEANQQDLSPLFDAEELPERPFAYGGYFNHFFVRNDHWAYVADNRGEGRQLYDLTLDPAELNDVAPRTARCTTSSTRRGCWSGSAARRPTTRAR
jgi:hypothetical protein